MYYIKVVYIILICAVFAGCANVSRFEKGRVIAFGEPLGTDSTPLYYIIGIDLEKSEELEIPRLYLKIPNGPPLQVDKITPKIARQYLTETIPLHIPVWKRSNLEIFVGHGYRLEFIDNILVYAGISDISQGPKPAIGISKDKLYILPLTEKQLIEIVGKPDNIYKVLEVHSTR